MKNIIWIQATFFLVCLAVAGCQPQAQLPDEPEIRIVSMRNFEFVPESISIYEGQTITWQNNDQVLHTVTGFGVDVDVPAGEMYSHTFSQSGTYEYSCTIHPGMDGTVEVLPV